MTGTRRTQDVAVLQQLRQAAHRRAVPTPPPADTCEYDWTCPHRFTAAERRRLDALAQRTAERLGGALAALLRTRITFGAAEVTQHYASAIADAETPVYRVPAHDAAGEPCGIAQLPAAQARGWVETLLGGSATPDEGDRQLSSLETDLLLDLVSAIVQALATVSKESGGPDLRRGEAVMGQAETLPVSDDHEFCRFAFKATGDDCHDQVTVYLRSERLDTVAGRAGDAAQPLGPGQTRARLLGHLHRAPVQVTAQLGAARISVRDLMNLEPGDVVVLETGISEPITVEVGGQPALRGVPAASNGRYAVQVLDLRDHPRLGLGT